MDIAKLTRSLYPVECLTRSIVLVHLLSRYGIEARLVIGARTIFGPLDAHAWVEVDGEALNEKEEVERIYEPFDINKVR